MLQVLDEGEHQGFAAARRPNLHEPYRLVRIQVGAYHCAESGVKRQR